MSSDGSFQMHKTDIPVLETSRLVLRGHTLDDVEASAAMWAEPDVVRFISGTPSTREESWSRFLRNAGHWQWLGFGYWVLECKETGAFLGEAGMANYQRQMEPSLGARPEAGWVLTPAARGQGLATEAMICITAWADRHLDCSATVCILDPDHQASRRVAEKVGFKNIGQTVYKGQPTLVMERRPADTDRA